AGRGGRSRARRLGAHGIRHLASEGTVMSRTRKQTFRGALVALLILLLLAGARWVFLQTIYEPPVEAAVARAAAPAPLPAPPPAPVVHEAVVESVSGRVERNLPDGWTNV